MRPAMGLARAREGVAVQKLSLAFPSSYHTTRRITRHYTHRIPRPTNNRITRYIFTDWPVTLLPPSLASLL